MAGEWIECALADACSSIDYGLTAPASDHSTGPRFLRITDIVSGHIDWNTVPHVVADTETSAKYRLDDGDVVLARTGASTGASAYVKNPPAAVFASYLVRLKARSEFDSRFLAYYLQSEDFWTFIRGVLGDKSAQPNASASTMANAPLRAPRDKNEQRAIAHILGTLDDKIELNRRMSETLEAMARALFKAWFVDFEPVRAKHALSKVEGVEGRWQRGQSLPGLPPHLYDLFPDRLVDSELGEIPEGWDTKRVSDYLSLAYGKSLPAGKRCQGGIPVYGSGGITGLHNEALVNGPAVIVGRKGTVGTLYWEHRPCFPIDTVFYVQPEAPLSFCYYLLESLPLRGMNTDAAVPGLNRENVYRLEIAAPPAKLISTFAGTALRFHEGIAAISAESETLAQLRDTLLPKLISGELRVPDAERLVEGKQ